MKRVLLLVLPLLVGAGAGIGAGLWLRPPPGEGAPEAAAAACPPGTGAAAAEAAADAEGNPTRDYVKLNNQFVVPVVDGAAVRALVILSLTLEVGLGTTEQVYQLEPKLRDGFLQVLFDHANAGGFAGNFTGSNNLDVLRKALRDVAVKIVGPTVKDVLITDIVRQDA
ncbi:MAG: flagellar basal body-associated FliL family protein [Rhodobacteraceae bacterium]|nr:flagellar basal body-associated FliL family protein [Paracoccaceae bacterium]